MSEMLLCELQEIDTRSNAIRHFQCHVMLARFQAEIPSDVCERSLCVHLIGVVFHVHYKLMCRNEGVSCNYSCG